MRQDSVTGSSLRLQPLTLLTPLLPMAFFPTLLSSLSYERARLTKIWQRLGNHQHSQTNRDNSWSRYNLYM